MQVTGGIEKGRHQGKVMCKQSSRLLPSGKHPHGSAESCAFPAAWGWTGSVNNRGNVGHKKKSSYQKLHHIQYSQQYISHEEN